MFTKQVSRSMDSPDPPSWPRRRSRSSNSKKDLVTGPDPRFLCPSRYSALFKLKHVPGAWLAHMLARLQIRYPEVQVVFANSRKFAEEWTYRFLAAALADATGAGVE